MIKEELRILFSYDNIAQELNKIDSIILNEIDSENFSQEVLSVYKKFQPMKQNAPESMKVNLFSTIRNFAFDSKENCRHIDSLILYRFLIAKNGVEVQDFPFIAEIFVKMNYKEEAIEFINYYKDREENLPLKYITLGNFYNIFLKDFKTAIKYYEKYVEIDKTKSVVYTILANLYLKAYGENSRSQQLFYWEKANNLKPNDRLILHGLAFCSEKLGKTDDAHKYYKMLLKNNPTATDYYNYGAFLIHCGDFVNGHKYFVYRNFIDNEVFNKTLTPQLESIQKLKGDLSGKTLLVHYEQGFGDTIMYSRYVPKLQNIAKKVIFVVQDALYDLIKNSKFFNGVEIISDSVDINKLAYDLPIMLLDAPMLLSNPDPEVICNNAYLNVPSSDIKQYSAKNIIKDNKFKIGIAYSGDKSANYDGRDIDLRKFSFLKSYKNCQIYSLQKDETETIDGIIPLGMKFKDFTDTACAIKNMDLVISTDNVILNLAGALGVKTIGLFNKQTNYRWYITKGKNVGWYKSVYPIQAKSLDDWDSVFSELINSLQNLNKTQK